MVLSFKEPFKGHFSCSPREYWGQATLQKEINFFFFSSSNLKCFQLARMHPRGESLGTLGEFPMIRVGDSRVRGPRTGWTAPLQVSFRKQECSQSQSANPEASKRDLDGRGRRMKEESQSKDDWGTMACVENTPRLQPCTGSRSG